VAGNYALLVAQLPDAAGVAGGAGYRRCKCLKGMIGRSGLPYVSYNMGCIVHLQTSGVLLLDTSNVFKLLRLKDEARRRKHMMEEMGAAYTAHGLITLAGSRIYTSLADTDDVVDDALNRFDDVFKLV
jgi:glutamate-1-semialdehyde 2,1-aminomutase